MGSDLNDFNTASLKLLELQENQLYLGEFLKLCFVSTPSEDVSDAIEQEIRREGEKLSDMLSMPVKDALGQEINTDYSEDIINIRDVLDATVARKNIFR